MGGLGLKWAAAPHKTIINICKITFETVALEEIWGFFQNLFLKMLSDKIKNSTIYLNIKQNNYKICTSIGQVYYNAVVLLGIA